MKKNRRTNTLKAAQGNLGGFFTSPNPPNSAPARLLHRTLDARTALALVGKPAPPNTPKLHTPPSRRCLGVELNGADAVGAQLDALTAKGAHLADMLARAKRDAGLIALPVHDTAKQYPSTKVGDPVTYHVVGEKLPRKISTKAPQRAPAKKTRTR